MKISYAGDAAVALRFTQMAQQEFYMLKSRPSLRGRFARSFINGSDKATVWFTIGDGMDGIHIVATADQSRASVPTWLSGAIIDQGHSYAPTTTSIEKFQYATHPLSLGRIEVPSHVSMPTRIDFPADNQYSAQPASKYTGKMARLVQLILGYGKLRPDSALAVAISKFKDGAGHALVYPPSVLWTKENVSKGVQNSFGWEWARTNGIFTRTHVVGETIVKDHWLIDITPAGVKAMPLQLEWVTTLPQFRAYIESEVAKFGHKKYLEDIITVLDEFGGYPSNEAFLSKVDAIKNQAVTILNPGDMELYANGSAVSADHGWAFKDDGLRANTVCLERFSEGAWYVAHHCQLSFYFDEELGRPGAIFQVLESGSAPLSKRALKVGWTAIDNCISYNIGWPDDGDVSGRPRADRTAMFVFWKNDRLECLRWSDGLIDPVANVTETTGDSWDSTTETWSGSTGLGAGFFCTLHDGRIPNEEFHRIYTSKQHLANEKHRAIGYSPANDEPEWFVREFYVWREYRTRTKTGARTDDCCAFVPVGDRSAFYIATMVTTGRYEDDLQVTVSAVNDPYDYSARSTYIWNWDFGVLWGHKFPVTWGGLTVDGVANVIWTRGGGGGKYQLDWYGEVFVIGPGIYKGGYQGNALYESALEAMAEWTARTGMEEWYEIGDEAIPTLYQPFTGAAPTAYNHVTPSQTTLSVYLVSLQGTKEVFSRTGSYSDIYHDYNYWFDRSPNGDGDYQTMWAFKNHFGGQFYQLYSTDVNDRNLAVEGGYALDPRDFPTFIGVVGDIPA